MAAKVGGSVRERWEGAVPAEVGEQMKWAGGSTKRGRGPR